MGTPLPLLYFRVFAEYYEGLGVWHLLAGLGETTSAAQRICLDMLNLYM